MTPDAVVLVPQSPASNDQAPTGQPGGKGDAAAAARLRARLERRVIALPRSSRGQ